jgi:hypothetical protein
MDEITKNISTKLYRDHCEELDRQLQLAIADADFPRAAALRAYLDVFKQRMADQRGPERLPFDQEAIGLCQNFAQDILSSVPEMEGVAIIPSWVVPQPHLPMGLVAGRDGPLRSPQEIEHMAVQMHGCLRLQLENAYRLIQNLDGAMGQIAAALAEKQRALNTSQNTPDEENHGPDGNTAGP